MTLLIHPPKSRIRQNQWDLDDILPLNHQIPHHYFEVAPVGVVENFQRLLSRDVFSEGDAQTLYHYLLSRQDEFTDAFLGMLTLWLGDELKHYEALRRTYHCIAGISFTEMNTTFSQRISALDPIQRVLADEFTILVTFMFDEIGSVYSYRRDLWEYYRHFGRPIQKVAHYLIKDEGMHFNNAAELLLHHHAHRLHEVESFLGQISILEKSLNQYHKTFFLDHAQEQYRFPKHFNDVIIRVILARLGLAQQPKQSALTELWQWVPEGYHLVPILEPEA